MGRRNAARLVAVVATLAVTGVGAAAPASAVSGGALAAGTYPFVAKITMDGRACTGVLIDPQWVLSAASCFPGTPQGGVPSPAVTVTMGRADLAATGGQVAHAKTLVRRSDRDLMLIQLDATVAAAAAAPLALGATTPAAGEALRIAGYGRTEAEWVPNQVHSSTFSVASSTATSVALTGDNGADTCKGDAGGPVWRDGGGHPELVAISATSWQHGCLGVTDTRQGSTATRTDDLSDWLRQQMLAPQARAVADHTITLSWNPVAGQGYTSYRVYGATTPDVPVGSATLLATTAATTFTHGPLPARQTWYYRVVGVTAAGQAGPSSVVVSATTRIPTTTDFNGDGRDDIATFTRGDAADVYVATSDGSRFVGNNQKWQDFFATGQELPLSGDFDGDGKTDIVTFTRGDNGKVYVALSTGTAFGPGVVWHNHFSLGTEVPAVGDFNGDGRDDIATFTRGSTGDVFVALSDGTQFVGDGIKWHDQFALNTEVPEVGDFNGDGRDDIATFTRADNGKVYVGLSTGTGFLGGAVWHNHFSLNEEVPGAGDFTGDGKEDVATFTRGDAHSVYAATSSGTQFVGDGLKWHDSFCFGSEIPLPGSIPQ